MFSLQLLAPDIRHERNILLQCVRYIVRKNFFGVGTKQVQITEVPTNLDQSEGDRTLGQTELKEIKVAEVLTDQGQSEGYCILGQTEVNEEVKVAEAPENQGQVEGDLIVGQTEVNEEVKVAEVPTNKTQWEGDLKLGEAGVHATEAIFNGTQVEEGSKVAIVEQVS